MNYIRDFTQLNKNYAHLAGGKGASLGEMTKAGLPVPPGFVILSTAFEKFLEKANLKTKIDSVLSFVNPKNIDEIEKDSKKIRTLIIKSEIPKDIIEEITQSFRKLFSKYVAVRSSATAEDSAADAWAGQLETYLNTNKHMLLKNVKKCWASLFTHRAISYRFERGLQNKKISVAVVVQKMVASDVSGVAFSVNPVTEDYNHIVIEAGFGLGEPIVSGQITPDNYIIAKPALQIHSKNVFQQETALFRAKGGGNIWKKLSFKKGNRQTLSDKEIKELAQHVVNIENYNGFPVDVEWAKERKKFYIVQSRPITTLGGNQSPRI